MVALSENTPVTTATIAVSIQTNPVLVRRLMSKLKKPNLIKTQTKLGATGLARPSEEISMLDIFKAVEEEQRVFDIHTNTNLKCAVGANIERVLTKIRNQVQQDFERELAGIPLSSIVNSISREESEQCI
ncbi:MAG: Rrf2 family transcriptional regulator [Oscillospiraceae bacterium]